MTPVRFGYLTVPMTRRVRGEQLRKEAEAVGYTVEKVDESLPEQRIVILAP